jgi:hypothetical protein
MRTKTLLLTAALSAVGLTASLAQSQSVFSVNAVGYINVEIPEGFSMVANQLKTTANTVPELFSSLTANGTTVYKFDPSTGQYASSALLLGTWSDPTMTFDPGEGAFVLNPAGAGTVTVTFVGEVSQGDLSHAVPAGFSVQSSEVPQSGQLDTELGLPVANGTVVYRYDNAAGLYVSSSFLFGSWTPTIPVPEVGEAFFLSAPAAASWTRTFSVNTTN